MIRSARAQCTRLMLAIALAAGPAVHGAALAQQSGARAPEQAEGGLLSEDFAQDSGAIIVIGQRPGEGNLFEAVETPKDSCLANAPRLGAPKPGFVIDAARFKKVSQLEAVRRKTRTGPIFVSGGRFVGADLRKAKLYNMCFFGTDFSQSDWSGVSAAGLGFIDVDLTGATMKEAHLPDVLLRDTRLELVNAAGARWMQGRLDGGWKGSLRGLDLSNADLTDFRIVCGTSAQDGCPLEREEIVLNGANLRRASLATFFASDMSLNGARIDQTELALDHLALVTNARLAGPVVLRSVRRAVMLFPQEVARLAEVARAADQPFGACAESGTAQVAMAVMCQLPGSAPRALLRSVTRLEDAVLARGVRPTGQQAWLDRRDACLAASDPDEQPACLFEAYRARQADLRRLLGAPDWLGRPGYRLFLSREAAFPTDRDEPGLYGRILPVLLDTAVAAVIVRTDGAGAIAAKGVAPGGCAFDVSGLPYDVEQAALGFPAAASAKPRPPRGRKGGRRPPPAPPPAAAPLVLIGEDGAATIGAGLARASTSCEGDSAFPALDEIALDDRLLAEIWERF
jgi:uncharacterized protein YjbI with pentapeptide repeats